MKKIVFVFLLIAVLPINLLAFDHCVNPDKYTIDRRCYVAGDWSTEPYKHVLKMGYVTGRPWCTANMVAGKIVTAKHCVLDKNLNNVKFTAFDGTEIYVDSTAESGSYYAEKQVIDGEEVEKEYNFDGDWSVLTPKQEYQKFVIDNSIFRVNVDSSEPWIFTGNDMSGVDFMIIGFGALKIMSDEEIEKFRRAYVDFLYDQGLYDDAEDIRYKLNAKYPVDWVGKRDVAKHETFKRIRTVDLKDGGWGQNFLLRGAEYMKKYEVGLWLYDTNNIKVSHCLDKWNEKNWDKDQGCQTWGGDSGGGVYSFWKIPLLKETEFLGVHTRGRRTIGDRHAGSNDNVPAQFFIHKLPEANKR